VSVLAITGFSPVTEARRAELGLTAHAPRGGAIPAAASRAYLPAVPARTSGERTFAAAILAERVAEYPILEGSTVEYGDTGENPEAHVYYKSARIVIDPDHTVSLRRIIDHEIWHIIDWRDNGRIDWGESVPPSNAGEYRR